jgi:methylase of polypeptide subunit release factors
MSRVFVACSSAGLLAFTFAALDRFPHDEARKPDVPIRFRSWHEVEGFPVEVAQFETVFWEPQVTTSLRKLIRKAPLVRNKTVLEIGTGTGLLSLLCLQEGATRAVATDINPAAIENARYNADMLGVANRLETRLVPLDNSEAFSVVDDFEQFDLIISNPPWENDKPKTIDLYAYYDRDFALMRSLIEGLDKHLAVDGRVLLAYGCVTAIEEVKRLSHEHGFSVRVLDERRLEDSPEIFLPGMLLELRRASQP